MTLRTRLAVSLGLATVSALVILGWAQSNFQKRVRLEALTEATVHRMESGGREACEAQPESWPGNRHRALGFERRRRHRGPSQPRVSAYDANFESRNPTSPAFPPELAKRLASGESVATSSDRGRGPRQIAVMMPWSEGPCAVLLLRAKGPGRWFSPPILLPALLVTLLVVTISLLVAGPIVRRVRRLTDAVEHNRPIESEGTDEIADLGRAFAQNRDTIETQLHALREREAALRNYIANTSHDVMLPLSVLQGHLVALQQRLEAGETLDSSALVPSLEEAHYLGSLLHNLNASARLEAQSGLAHRDPIDLHRLIERVVERHRPVARRKQVALELATPESAIVTQGDVTLLEQALGNVVQNAVRYNHENGHVAVTLDGTEAGWTIVVADDGPGIPAAERDEVLLPSFRGSAARTRHPHGMGLGLHIASDVLARHGLALRLSETTGGGLTVTICQPQTTAPDT